MDFQDLRYSESPILLHIWLNMRNRLAHKLILRYKPHILIAVPNWKVRIYRKFAEDVGFLWGGSLAIRAGEALQGRAGKTLDNAGSMGKKVKKALVRMADSLSQGSPSVDQTLSVIPESFYRGPFSFVGSFFIWLNNLGWASRAKKQGGNVSARPYVKE